MAVTGNGAIARGIWYRWDGGMANDKIFKINYKGVMAGIDDGDIANPGYKVKM